ncbi:outer membrane beta-barrel protein [Thalassotalea sediminis]|uniref:outer membrane beta-barrel protein n=1 Tax=Thalassotalea sediminis TaxID=1759089 RepID=UPI0025744925|nr:outer membrane beta-barrel protein [Thalassotalea sediminis]
MNRKQHLLFIGSLALCSFTTLATSSKNLPVGNTFNLAINGEVGRIDNFLFDDVNEHSTNYWALSPELFLQVVNNRHLLSLDVKTTLTKYDEFEQDDHTNVSISPQYMMRFADNKTIFIRANHQQQYELRGTGLSLANAEMLNKGDKRQLSDISMGLQYGGASVALLEVAFGISNNKYQTRREVTKQLDNSNIYGKASFDYQLDGGTMLSAALEFEQLEYEYQAIYDKQKYTALIGGKWPKSAVNQLSMLLGYQNITFKQSTFENDDAFKWRVSWYWSPVESLTFNLTSERDFAEANRLNNSYRLVDKHMMTLTNEWSEYISLSASIGFNQEQVTFEAQKQKEDYLNSAIKLDYHLSKELRLFLKYQMKDLRSTKSTFEYQRNSISIGINVTI